MRQFISFIKKEFLCIFRDTWTMIILLVLPVMMLILFGFGISTEIKNTRVAVYDPSRDVATQQIVNNLSSSEYFIIDRYLSDISGFGLIVSNYANNIQQAIFIMFFFIMTMIFLSGLFTPFQNMPQWAQIMGNASPLKFFIQSLRMIYLKGATFTDMQHLFYPLCALAVFFNGWAVLSYRKKS